MAVREGEDLTQRAVKAGRAVKAVNCRPYRPFFQPPLPPCCFFYQVYLAPSSSFHREANVDSTFTAVGLLFTFGSESV